jgi:hypothetical protein
LRTYNRHPEIVLQKDHKHPITETEISNTSRDRSPWAKEVEKRSLIVEASPVNILKGPLLYPLSVIQVLILREDYVVARNEYKKKRKRQFLLSDYNEIRCLRLSISIYIHSA